VKIILYTVVIPYLRLITVYPRLSAYTLWPVTHTHRS
jgi:hypothetical protein